MMEAILEPSDRNYSCLPGSLGYFEGEEIGERYVLERRGGPTKR